MWIGLDISIRVVCLCFPDISRIAEGPLPTAKLSPYGPSGEGKNEDNTTTPQSYLRKPEQ